MATVFRPSFGRVLSIAVWVLCLAGLVLTLRAGLAEVLRVLPYLALVAGLVWAMFYHPRVVVDDGGVHLVNVLRTIDIPWPAIRDVDTKWSLTLITAYGRFTAWAAPAPGGLATARRITRTDREAIPRSARGPGDTVRPGDLPDTASGSAALIIRHKWEELRDAGYLDDPHLEFAAVPVRWHWLAITIGSALLVACLLTAVL